MVFPTHVGVNLWIADYHIIGVCLPHTRGGEGYVLPDGRMLDSVFPTHVGVNLTLILKLSEGSSLPHTRGGEPKVVVIRVPFLVSSPHTWG